MKRNKNKKLIKLASKFQPWDYGFNLEIERAMFKKMREFFSSNEPVSVGSERVAKEIKLAINLLNIILDENTAITWIGGYEWRLVKYVNTKNASRFCKFPNLEDVVVKNYLRQSKAWYLYHKLRYYRMQSFWD